MNKQAIFENRKKRLLREFPKTFPGQTPPEDDEEVLYWLDEEQHLARRNIVACNYKSFPDLTPPTSREDVDAWFIQRDLEWKTPKVIAGIIKAYGGAA
jgi:hypothetical protein